MGISGCVKLVLIKMSKPLGNWQNFNFRGLECSYLTKRGKPDVVVGRDYYPNVDSQGLEAYLKAGQAISGLLTMSEHALFVVKPDQTVENPDYLSPEKEQFLAEARRKRWCQPFVPNPIGIEAQNAGETTEQETILRDILIVSPQVVDQAVQGLSQQAAEIVKNVLLGQESIVDRWPASEANQFRLEARERLIGDIEEKFKEALLGFLNSKHAGKVRYHIED